MFSTSSLPSSLPDASVDPSPLLRYSVSDQIVRSRRVLRRTSPPLLSAARFFQRASGRRMMLREPSVRVRENAAEQLEARQSTWAYSKPVVILDVVWNMASVTIGIVVLGLSMEEKPSVPLRVWMCGCLVEGVFHCVGVIVKFQRRRREADANFVLLEQNQNENGNENENINGNENRRWERVGDLSSSSGSDAEDSREGHTQEGEGCSIRKFIESVIAMLSFLWWLLGFYWVTTGGQSLTQDSPKLYWLCITFLAFEIAIVFICVAVACLVGIAVCCCLPCILALLSLVTAQDGATKEEINQLPKYKFRRVDEKENGDVQGSCTKGVMTECDSDTPAEHFLSMEDAECCICLSAYEDGVELRELPCNHHFHIDCIDKWLHINATCPLCKCNVLIAGKCPEEV